MIPKDGGNNMLKSAIWQELRELDWIIKNITAKYEDEEFTYEQICARWLDQCFNNDILNLHHVIKYAWKKKTISYSNREEIERRALKRAVIRVEFQIEL